MDAAVAADAITTSASTITLPARAVTMTSRTPAVLGSAKVEVLKVPEARMDERSAFLSLVAKATASKVSTSPVTCQQQACHVSSMHAM